MSKPDDDVDLFSEAPMDVEESRDEIRPLPPSPTHTQNADSPTIIKACQEFANHFELGPMGDPLDQRLEDVLPGIWFIATLAFPQRTTRRGRLASWAEFQNNVGREEGQFMKLLRYTRANNSWRTFLDNDIFLKQNQEVLPASNPLNSSLVIKYRPTFITLANPQVWTNADISSNNVVPRSTLAPKLDFVTDFESMLGKKRRIPHNWQSSIQTLLKFVPELQQYCDFTYHVVEEDTNWVTQAELAHLIHIASIEPSKWWKRKGHGRAFKQPDADWLFFYPVASPYGSDEASISVNVGELHWPFKIIVQDNQNACYSYHPKNDFAVFLSAMPAFLVEINSLPRGQPPQDHYRMLLQAASVIRFANEFLEEYKTTKNFIVIAAYVDDDGKADRYILFQDKEANPNDVYYKTQTFNFNETADRISFAREMYNFFSALNKKPHNADALDKIRHFQSHINDYRSVHGLKTLTSLKKGRQRTGQRDNRDANNSGGGGTVQQLETHGYVMIPDIIEDKGGQMESLIKLPPHILTVYRSTDATRLKLVAKHIDKQSTELEILQYLCAIQPQSSQIISLSDVVPTNAGNWAIFLKMSTVESNLSMCPNDSRLGGKIVQLCRDLIDGLAYLHEHGIAHLDIKPGNLVSTGDFRLQIIDFGSAVQVGSEHDTVKGVYGTQGWMAPEMGERSVFSPIRADRWSCGKVLLWFFETSGIDDGGLQKIAKQLMDDNPLCRPSLVNFSEEADLTLCNDADLVDEDGNKESKAQVKDGVEDEGVKDLTKTWLVDADVTLCNDADSDEVNGSKVQVKDDVKEDGELKNGTKTWSVDVGSKAVGVAGLYALTITQPF